MSSSSSIQRRSGGVTLLGLLGIAFVVLKLVGVVAWPWVWVVAPFWIPVAFFLVVLAAVALIALLGGMKS